MLSRFFGGNILSLIAFFQHGLVIASDVYDVHGNTVDYHFTEHGNLGDDYPRRAPPETGAALE